MYSAIFRKLHQLDIDVQPLDSTLHMRNQIIYHIQGYLWQADIYM